MEIGIGKRIVGAIFVTMVFTAYSHLAVQFFERKYASILGNVFFGFAVFLVIFLVVKSKKEPNKYGLGSVPFQLPKINKNYSPKIYISFVLSSLVALVPLLVIVFKMGGMPLGLLLFLIIGGILIYGMGLVFGVIK